MRFTSNKNKNGYLEYQKRPWRDLLSCVGIENLCLHDLCRKMGSYQAITGASTNIIGKSVGHKPTSAPWASKTWGRGHVESFNKRIFLKKLTGRIGIHLFFV